MLPFVLISADFIVRQGGVAAKLQRPKGVQNFSKLDAVLVHSLILLVHNYVNVLYELYGLNPTKIMRSHLFLNNSYDGLT